LVGWQLLQQCACPVRQVSAQPSDMLECRTREEVSACEAASLPMPPLERRDECDVVGLGISGELALGGVGLGLLTERAEEGGLVAESGADGEGGLYATEEAAEKNYLA